METIADYPAYRIYRTYAGRKFGHGEVIALPWNSASHGTLWTFYTLGTVEGYAVKNGECPHEALARHLESAERFKDGRKAYWANQNAVVISNVREAKRHVPGFDWGDSIILQGKSYRLEKAPNQNCSLVPLEG